MQSYLFLGPTSIDGSGASISHYHTSSNLFGTSFIRSNRRRSTTNSRCISASATAKQNHYAVLGVSPNASSSDIKKAFRLLARKMATYTFIFYELVSLKYHPDVNKDSRAGEVFKKIRCAYEVLSNTTTRNQYDRDVRLQSEARQSWKDNLNDNAEFKDGDRIYNRWADLRQKTRHNRSWERHETREESYSSYYYETYEYEVETPEQERLSFVELLKSAVLSIFLMKTIGPGLSLTFSSIMALLDHKLDDGYKMGYVIAWGLGGIDGIFLTLFLSFARWVFSKKSGGIFTQVVGVATQFAAAIWMGTNLARLAVIPRGALITLLYMTIKLPDI